MTNGETFSRHAVSEVCSPPRSEKRFAPRNKERERSAERRIQPEMPRCAASCRHEPALRARQRALSGRARLPALCCGSRRGFEPPAQLQAMLPGTWFRRALPALPCPSPVTAPHTSAVVPRGLIPEAARERSASFRARAPPLLRPSKCPRERRPLQAG
jgi:hypothetical protein